MCRKRIQDEREVDTGRAGRGYRICMKGIQDEREGDTGCARRGYSLDTKL